MSFHSIVTRLRSIPDRYRDFNTVESNISKQFGIDVSVLSELNSAGLPRKKIGMDTYYASSDLAALSLYLGTPSLRYMQFRCWSATLRLSQELLNLSAKISFIPAPDDHRDEVCSFDLLIPHEGRVRVAGRSGTPVRIIEQQMRVFWPEFPLEVKKVLREIEELDYFLLPEEVRWDLDFIHRTKMADCGGASKLLFWAAKQSGMKARHYLALFINKPFSHGHYCTDILVEDTWVPADPVLLKLLRFMGRLDASFWTFDRSPGVAVVPLANINEYAGPFGQPILEGFENEGYLQNPSAMMDGHEIPISFPTEIRTGGHSSNE